MAERKGTLVGAPIKAPDDQDVFAPFESDDGKGGLHQVETTTDRNNIPSHLRVEGMLVTVRNFLSGFPKTFRLGPGITNSDWKVFEAGAGLRVVDLFTLSVTDLNNKYIQLTATPIEPTDVVLEIAGAPIQRYGVDYVMDGAIFDRLRWNGLDLDGLLEVGEELTVTYQA